MMPCPYARTCEAHPVTVCCDTCPLDGPRGGPARFATEALARDTTLPPTPLADALAAWLDRDDVSENRAADEVRARRFEVEWLLTRVAARERDRAAPVVTSAGIGRRRRWWGGR